LVALSEVLWVLTKPMRQSQESVRDILARLLKAPNIELQSRGAVEAALRRLEHSGEPIHDSLIAELDRAAGCRYTVTFDIKAAKRSGFKLLVSAD
jgi:predicted nucleic-acid-binding protein